MTDVYRSGRTVLAVALALLLWISVMAVPITATPGSSAGAEYATENVEHADAAPAGSAPADLNAPDHGTADASGDGWATSSGMEEDEWRQSVGSDAIADGDTIHLTNHLRRVDEAGEYEVESQVSIPDKVTKFELLLPDHASDVQASGFERSDDGAWEWDGTTENPWLTYRMPANQTTDGEGPLEGKGNHLFVDAGEWAIVQPPSLGARWSWTGGGQVRLARENTARDGAASRAMAYLGPYEQHTSEANGQRFRLVVPAAAELEESPDTVLDELAYASEALQVGERDAEVLVIAAPTGDVQWGVRGLQTGAADMWVRDVEPLDDAENVWLHEYVHTRQAYRTDASARWFTEASATYYAALLTLERGETGFDDFRDVLRHGERDPQASSILAEPPTWRNHAEYTKGALVAAEIDRRIRLATDGEKSLATVFRGANAANEQVTNDDLLRSVGDAGGPEVHDEAAHLTTTRSETSSWGRATHDDAFGTIPARIGYSVADDDAVRISGEFRDRSISVDDRDPIELVTGETLEIAVTASNAGGTAGEYELDLVVDGEVRDERAGRLASGESTVERFEQEFTQPGDYRVEIGGETIAVVVSEPATLSVTDLDADTRTVAVDEPTTVTVTVHNPERVPGRETIDVRVDGDAVANETVTLEAGATTEFNVTVRLDEPGEAVVAAGDRTVTLRASEEDDEGGIVSDLADRVTSDGASGFGVVVALVALLLAALVTRRRP